MVEAFQQRLNSNKWASVALDVPQKYGVKNRDLPVLAKHLYDYQDARTCVGKATHRDLLMQEATRWAKQRAQVAPSVAPA